MSEYIHEGKKVSNEYPNIFPWKKSTNIWAKEYICQYIFEYIWKSEFLLHTDTNKYPNIFGCNIMYQTNIWIFLDATYLPNKYPNIFVRQK